MANHKKDCICIGCEYARFFAAESEMKRKVRAYDALMSEVSKGGLATVVSQDRLKQFLEQVK